ncbi:hypothetical protein RRG08_010136 [Elysia crispata]|uniref:Uncharacterized protein n=1 Tax=Elysia crispata TaxID=231223 RepID=A0AAE1DHZ9_9GAST|nr:hypothetical protein RRG08_010136 [Elysia crispata]
MTWALLQYLELESSSTSAIFLVLQCESISGLRLEFYWFLVLHQNNRLSTARTFSERTTKENENFSFMNALPTLQAT